MASMIEDQLILTANPMRVGGASTCAVHVSPSPLDIRGKIDALEAAMFEQPQVEIEATHTFADGLYAREIEIKAGTLLTGKIHKFEHINIVSKGSISVLTENGAKRIEAPCAFVSPPGTKRVGYAHEDTVWTTVHALPNNVRDPERAEDFLVTMCYDDVLDSVAAAALVESAK
jgi:hypothetical protein